MANDFTDETRLLNLYAPYCEKCGSNQNCSLHHIFSRISNSAVNGIYLCGECHREADAHNQLGGKSKAFKQELLTIRLKNLLRWHYTFNDKDKKFMERIHSDLIEVLKK